jgi:phospholipid-transporting ATPase
MDHRVIHINNSPLNEQQKFLHNSISTAKYTWYTFLLKFLMEQFSKYANLFFLFISIIQQIPNVSPTSPLTTVATLIAVLFATALKEVLEDYVRSLKYQSPV